jgi:hypothetical protein
MRYRFSPGVPVFLSLFLLVFGSFLCAASPDATPVQDRASAAREFTLARLAVWQQRLDLQSWKVSLLVSRANKLKRGAVGDVEWDSGAKTATIRVLDPADYRLSYDDMLKDMEFTVLHGLIHLEISSLPRDRHSRGREDLAVSQLADALLSLDRGSK